jgi:uncharacterized membrane protein (GlpM family)
VRLLLVQFLVRFLAGGTLVAAVPLVAVRATPTVAGVLVLAPVVTLSAFYFIGEQQGAGAVHTAAGSAMIALPAVGAFLGGVFLSSQRCTNILFILGTGVTAWLICAIPIVLLESPSQKG